MKIINDLVDLLEYEVENLYCSEELIEQHLPSIIQKANHKSLKNALQHHANLTSAQKQRLNHVRQQIHHKRNEPVAENRQPDVSFAGKGIAGLLQEINELLNMQIAAEVTDAAIIASVQKIEHYEICGYGTALAFAKQLQLHSVAKVLNETLQEEYDADDLLTSLATAAMNKEAVPEHFEGDEQKIIEPENYVAGHYAQPMVSINERSINSPGGRAGTSHRRYGSGESRGH